MMYTSTTGEMSDIDGTIGLLFTHQNDEFVAILIEAAPSRSYPGFSHSSSL